MASGLMAFATIQLALNVVLDGPGAALRDAEFGEKLDRLRSRLEEAPDRPLVLLLGSSRSANGVSPGRLATVSTPDGRKPLVFNFALTGHGPVQELMLLRRLLRRGIRPEQVLVEVHPAMLHQERGVFGEEIWMRIDRLEACDLEVFRRYVAEPIGWSWREPRHWPWSWWHARLVPAWSHRLSIVSRVAPAWLEAGSRQD